MWPDLNPWSVLDEGFLRSALAAPYAGYGGEEFYPTVPAKAACLFRGLVKNHALDDGNKRLGVVTTTVFLLINGWEPRYTSSELYLYALRVAAHEGNYPAQWIEGWIRRKCRLAPPAQLRAARRQIERFWATSGYRTVHEAIGRSGLMLSRRSGPPPTPEGHMAMDVSNGNGNGEG